MTRRAESQQEQLFGAAFDRFCQQQTTSAEGYGDKNNNNDDNNDDSFSFQRCSNLGDMTYSAKDFDTVSDGDEDNETAETETPSSVSTEGSSGGEFQVVTEVKTPPKKTRTSMNMRSLISTGTGTADSPIKHHQSLSKPRKSSSVHATRSSPTKTSRAVLRRSSSDEQQSQEEESSSAAAADRSRTAMSSTERASRRAARQTAVEDSGNKRELSSTSNKASNSLPRKESNSTNSRTSRAQSVEPSSSRGRQSRDLSVSRPTSTGGGGGSERSASVMGRRRSRERSVDPSAQQQRGGGGGRRSSSVARRSSDRPTTSELEFPSSPSKQEGRTPPEFEHTTTPRRGARKADVMGSSSHGRRSPSRSREPRSHQAQSVPSTPRSSSVSRRSAARSSLSSSSSTHNSIDLPPAFKAVMDTVPSTPRRGGRKEDLLGGSSHGGRRGGGDPLGGSSHGRRGGGGDPLGGSSHGRRGGGDPLGGSSHGRRGGGDPLGGSSHGRRGGVNKKPPRAVSDGGGCVSSSPGLFRNRRAVTRSSVSSSTSATPTLSLLMSGSHHSTTNKDDDDDDDDDGIADLLTTSLTPKELRNVLRAQRQKAKELGAADGEQEEPTPTTTELPQVPSMCDDKPSEKPSSTSVEQQSVASPSKHVQGAVPAWQLREHQKQTRHSMERVSKNSFTSPTNSPNKKSSIPRASSAGALSTFSSRNRPPKTSNTNKGGTTLMWQPKLSVACRRRSSMDNATTAASPLRTSDKRIFLGKKEGARRATMKHNRKESVKNSIFSFLDDGEDLAI
jgi:hypothetical protein